MKTLSEKLLDQLLEQCHELEESGDVRVVGINEKTKELIISVSYVDPENTGEHTIFHCC